MSFLPSSMQLMSDSHANHVCRAEPTAHVQDCSALSDLLSVSHGYYHASLCVAICACCWFGCGNRSSNQSETNYTRFVPLLVFLVQKKETVLPAKLCVMVSMRMWAVIWLYCPCLCPHHHPLSLFLPIPLSLSFPLSLSLSLLACFLTLDCAPTSLSFTLCATALSLYYPLISPLSSHP